MWEALKPILVWAIEFLKFRPSFFQSFEIHFWQNQYVQSIGLSFWILRVSFYVWLNFQLNPTISHSWEKSKICLFVWNVWKAFYSTYGSNFNQIPPLRIFKKNERLFIIVLTSFRSNFNLKFMRDAFIEARLHLLPSSAPLIRNWFLNVWKVFIRKLLGMPSGGLYFWNLRVLFYLCLEFQPNSVTPDSGEKWNSVHFWLKFFKFEFWFEIHKRGSWIVVAFTSALCFSDFELVFERLNVISEKTIGPDCRQLVYIFEIWTFYSDYGSNLNQIRSFLFLTKMRVCSFLA